ncbi:sulfatase family protein [Pontiella agarivorans]|uniref:Sulfatase n=1 Tax=Pontiella agarivorans TaxID=3038953 RepID=A0ABU5MTU4_9BACT|nr:sulfatase [Pontiella agarivorans]MDZ8117638.1 sulfatase [Pontiella agarivorans]
MNCFALTALAASALFSAQAAQPNIIIIFNDDQGYQDLGCYGSPDIRTPRVDELASEGMRFTDFYVGSPVCSASRAALLTGCYPYRVGVSGVFWPNRDHGLPPEETTLAEMLKKAGYATAAVGKWHLGDELRFLPTRQGFDTYFGIPYSNDMYPAEHMRYAPDCLWREGQNFQTLETAFAHKKRGQPRTLKNKVPLMRNEECIEFPCDQTTITRRYADESLRFISESVESGKPFFLYLANSMPHIPLFASPDFKGKSAGGLYGDVIEEIDFNTGRILDRLKMLGIEDDTIVIFSSDNGPWLTVGDAGGHADPLFEGKFTSFEGGQRVPFIIRWPGTVPAGTTCSGMAATIDLFPTLAALTGAELPEKKLDGVDLSSLWKNPHAISPRSTFFYEHNAVRSGNWKYHRKEIFKVKKTKRANTGPTLYNLKDDVGEAQNVIADHPEVAERLSKMLDAHIQYAPRPRK